MDLDNFLATPNSTLQAGQDVDYLLLNNGDDTIVVNRSPRYGFVKPKRKSTWLQVTAILVAELVGTGVLALPHAFSVVGLIPGILLLCFFSLFALYVGILLWRLQNHLPNAITYGDAAGDSLGKYGRLAVFGLLYTAFFGNLSLYLITCADTLRSFDNSLCTYTLTFITAIFLLPFCQLRTLHHVSYVAVGSGIAILLALIIIIWSISVETVTKGDVKMFHESTFIKTMSASTTAIFAFGGQGIFFETMAEMARPQDFPKSVTTSTFTILLIYLVVAVVCYLRFGNCVVGNVLYELTASVPQRVASAMVFFHVCISYVLAQQIICRAIHTRIAPTIVDTNTRKEKTQWFGISLGVMFIAWLFANLIPFFTSLMGIVGAITTAPLTFGFPCYMYYVTSKLYRFKIPKLEQALLVLLVVMAGYLMTVGLFSNLHELAHNEMAKPFSCGTKKSQHPFVVNGTCFDA